jgi:hypothetical protein
VGGRIELLRFEAGSEGDEEYRQIGLVVEISL